MAWGGRQKEFSGAGRALLPMRFWSMAVNLGLMISAEKFQDLLTSNLLLVVATLNADGSLQTSPVWFEYRDGLIWINSVKGRSKDRNLRERPVFSGTLLDPTDAFRYLEIRGTVVEVTEEGASEHIDLLAKRYLGVDRHPGQAPGKVRVIYKIKPTHFTGRDTPLTPNPQSSSS